MTSVHDLYYLSTSVEWIVPGMAKGHELVQQLLHCTPSPSVHTLDSMYIHTCILSPYTRTVCMCMHAMPLILFLAAPLLQAGSSASTIQGEYMVALNEEAQIEESMSCHSTTAHIPNTSHPQIVAALGAYRKQEHTLAKKIIILR